MPITAHPKASYQFAFRSVVKMLGIADRSDATGDTISANAPYSQDQIRKAIVQGDVEVCGLIASVEDHPYRAQFFTEEPDAINDGARIPAYIGIHGGVSIETGIGSNEFKPGRLAGSYDRLQSAKDNFVSCGSPWDLYYIDNGVLHTAGGQRGKVLVPTIPVADDAAATPTLSAPKVYQWGIVGAAISMMRMVGSDEAHRQRWENVWAQYVQLIIGRAGSLPSPEKMQRIAH